MKYNTKILHKLHLRTIVTFFLSFLSLCVVANPAAIHISHETFLSQNQDTIKTDVDTIKVTVDTVKVESPLKEPVFHTADDSLLYSVDGKKAYLFGNAEVKYQNLELSAALIEFDMETNVVFAKGLPDSAGVIVGKPVFKEGSQVYKMDEITYNFNTKRARITGVVTEEAGGVLHSKYTKKMENDDINIAGGKFTTCDLDHPHFYVGITKAKIIPGDRIITGPAYLVIEDVPFPLIIPFGFFPNSKGRSSGIIFPQYGEENNRGFFLRNAGFYFGFSDYVDLKITGSVFSKGSWSMSTQSNYRKRYKYSGNLSYDLSQTILEQVGSTETQKDRTYWLRWNHAQDPKANPTSNFRASVNFGSPNHRKYEASSVDNYLAGSINSSISYTKIWPGTPFSMSSSINHSQNNYDSTITIGAPKVSFNMSRISPFKRKTSIGAPAWYEKIGLSYSANFDNSISTKTNKLFTKESLDQFKNGVQHSIPVSTSFNILKYITLSPSVNYSENWYTKTIEKHWDSALQAVVIDTISGFKRAWQYNTGASLSTKFYGMYTFGSHSFVQAIRHVLTPSVSLGYRPDYGEEKYGYWKDVQINAAGAIQQYSIFEQGLYGGPAKGKSGTVSFSLGNNVEMKTLAPKDTTIAFRKIKLIENLSINSSYNLLLDSMNWSPVSVSARTTLFENVNINFGGLFNPYAIDSIGNALSSFNYTETGKLFRFTSARIGVGLALKSKKKDKGKTAAPGDEVGLGDNYLGDGLVDPLDDAMFGQALGTYWAQDDYVDFDIPWNVRFDYTFSYAKPKYEKTITQSVTFSGDLSFTPKWKIGFRSGYDFKNLKLTTTSINFYRDLHCWEMKLTVIPIGYLKSFSFQLNVKAGVLQDLKISKRQGHLDNL